MVNGLNTFVPTIQAQKGPSSIVITGSKQGITNPPGNVAYNATKSAVKTVAEHLNYDLKDTNTSVHLLVPGWTFTGLVLLTLLISPLYPFLLITRANHKQSGNQPGATKEKPAGAWSADQVADYLYKKMDEGKF